MFLFIEQLVENYFKTYHIVAWLYVPYKLYIFSSTI